MTNLQELRELIILLLLDKGHSFCLTKPFTLAMVLIAIEGAHFGLDTCEETPKSIWIYTEPYVEWIVWDLTKDLDNQSEEVIISLLNLTKGTTND